MTDDVTPPASFPAYQPPVPVNPNGLTFADPKQAKPLMKIINRMLHPRPKQRVSHVKKGVAKKKRGEVGWTQ